MALFVAIVGVVFWCYARQPLYHTDLWGHLAYGRLLLETGKIDHAMQELQLAVKLAPGSPDAHFALSRVLSTAGREKEAARQRKEFERLKALADAANQ